MTSEPAAFLSYARFNDLHDNGRPSAFRKLLAGEMQAQTGREFLIFQDQVDVDPGQKYQRRIDKMLDTVTLLIALISPSFFASPACRDEVARFLERERVLGRSDLILPVYYISARELEDPAVRESDEIIRELASRQFVDHRHLRFEPLSSPAMGKAVEQLALGMVSRFDSDLSDAVPELKR
jgi:F-box protein 11